MVAGNTCKYNTEPNTQTHQVIGIYNQRKLSGNFCSTKMKVKAELYGFAKPRP